MFLLQKELEVVVIGLDFEPVFHQILPELGQRMNDGQHLLIINGVK